MNSDEIFDVIEEVANTSSKTGKEALIRKFGGDEQFQKVLIAALNPFVTFGIAKASDATGLSAFGRVFDEKAWEFLNDLASRKLTGNNARSSLDGEMSRLSHKSRTLLWRIVSKDLRAGFSESTVNKAIPGLIPTFDCMLAHPFDAKRVKKWPQIAEPKLDGVRVLAFVSTDAQTVKFFSRSGKEYTTFDHLKPAILAKNHCKSPFLVYSGFNSSTNGDFILDGEVVSGSFNKTVSEVRKKDVQAEDAEFHIFDILPATAFSSDSKDGDPAWGTYTERRQRLQQWVGDTKEGPVKLLPRYLVNSEAEILALYDKVRARGLEGLIIKDPDGLYHRRRNHAWMKIKAEETTEIPIIGAYFGEPGKQFENTLGGLIGDFNGVEVGVGGGFSVLRDGKSRDEFMEVIQEELAELGIVFTKEIGRIVLTEEQLASCSRIFNRLMEVEFHEVTPDGSLRHPRFARFRDDKSAEE